MSFRYLISFLLVTPAFALTICAEPDNLPMSERTSRSGYEIEVAELLAKDLGEKLDVKWIAQRDHSYFRQTIGKDQCQAIMGVPAGFHRLTTTAPWYTTGFVFVSQNGLPQSFDDKNLSTLRIGVPATGLGETPPALALSKRGLVKNLRPYSIYEPKTMIEAVKKKEIDLAVVWGPFAGWFGKDLHVAPTPEKDGAMPLAFDVTIGLKKGNMKLKEKLDRAIARNRTKIDDILARWRVPVRGK
ncbi:MAG: quinoprotein dehydrogenase-associated putative ABC transporter substrate-binding protein [Bacteriovoracaceae bacterium]